MDTATRSGRFAEYNMRCACMAQLVEQLTLNQLVPGSNPGAGTIPWPLVGTAARKKQRSAFAITNAAHVS